MRFHMTAAIHVSDPSRVRRALETGLRDVTIETSCSGSLIMLRGLGPGSVSMNHDDFAVLTIEEHQDLALIEADGVFDGTYLGDSKEQENAVRSKLDHVFDEVQKQFDLEAQKQFELEDMRKPSVPAMVETRVKIEEKPKKAEEKFKKTEEKSKKIEEKPEEIKEKPKKVQPEHPPAVPIQMFVKVPQEPKPEAHPPVFSVRDDLPKKRLTVIPRIGLKQVGYLAVSISALALVFAVFEGVEREVHKHRLGSSVSESRPASIQGDLKNPGSSSPAISAPNAALATDDSPDPKTLLKRWEDAMRTRDAAVQSSFYADPVDRYQDQAFVTRTVLQQEKQVAIADRKGLWTVKLEGIVIERRAKDEVNVRLVKHFIDQPAPSQIVERFVQTQLLLRRVGGKWKIVSEQDVAQSADPANPAFQTLTARVGD